LIAGALQTEAAPSRPQFYVVDTDIEAEPPIPDGYSKIGGMLERLKQKHGVTDQEEAAARQVIGAAHYPDGESIAAYRLRRGWTQKQLADAYGDKGTSQSHIAKIEAGEDVRISTAEKLADALGVDACGVVAALIKGRK